MRADEKGCFYSSVARRTLTNVLKSYRVGLKEGLEINIVSQAADFYTAAGFMYRQVPYKFLAESGHISFRPEGKVENFPIKNFLGPFTNILGVFIKEFSFFRSCFKFGKICA